MAWRKTTTLQFKSFNNLTHKVAFHIQFRAHIYIAKGKHVQERWPQTNKNVYHLTLSVAWYGPPLFLTCLTQIPDKSGWTSAVKTVDLVNACSIVQTRVAVALADFCNKSKITISSFNCLNKQTALGACIIHWSCITSYLTRPFADNVNLQKELSTGCFNPTRNVPQKITSWCTSTIKCFHSVSIFIYIREEKSSKLLVFSSIVTRFSQPERWEEHWNWNHSLESGTWPHGFVAFVICHPFDYWVQ